MQDWYTFIVVDENPDDRKPGTLLYGPDVVCASRRNSVNMIALQKAAEATKGKDVARIHVISHKLYRDVEED